MLTLRTTGDALEREFARLRRQDMASIDWRVADMLALPFSCGAFDAVRRPGARRRARARCAAAAQQPVQLAWCMGLAGIEGAHGKMPWYLHDAAACHPMAALPAARAACLVPWACWHARGSWKMLWWFHGAAPCSIMVPVCMAASQRPCAAALRPLGRGEGRDGCAVHRRRQPLGAGRRDRRARARHAWRGAPVRSWPAQA